MRLIDADALKKNCAEVVKASNNSDFIPCPTWNKAMELIDSAPTVELQMGRMTNGYVIPVSSVSKLTEPETHMILGLTNDVITAIPATVGKWILHKDYNESCKYGCNKCGNLNNIPSNFCPNCGAIMRKEVQNEQIT